MSAEVIPVMPSRYTSAPVTRVWNARLAKIAALAAASKPSTSAVGSASAAALLCLGKRLGETDSGGVHAIQDVIRGAVDNPDH